MCGRLCCYRKPSTYTNTIQRRLKANKPPTWVDETLFKPSRNLAPTNYVPTLHVNNSNQHELTMQPMVWGIPFHPSREPGSSTMHNIRIDTLTTSKFFHYLVSSGSRCGVVCEGFYEWDGKHRPHFYFDNSNQTDTKKIMPSWQEHDWTEKGPPVMVLAGIYTSLKRNGKDRGHVSIVTTAASSNTSKIHHRVPILLETEEDLLNWLGPSKKTGMEILNDLYNIKNEHLCYYEVTNRMNKSSYQENDCHVPILNASSSGILNQWLTKGSKEDGPGPSQDSTSQRRSLASVEQQKVTQKESEKCPLKRKSTESSDQVSPKKKKTLITDWFKKREH